MEGGGRAEGEGSTSGTTQAAGAWWQAAGRHIWAFRDWSGGHWGSTVGEESALRVLTNRMRRVDWTKKKGVCPWRRVRQPTVNPIMVSSVYREENVCISYWLIPIVLKGIFVVFFLIDHTSSWFFKPIRILGLSWSFTHSRLHTGPGGCWSLIPLLL